MSKPAKSSRQIVKVSCAIATACVDEVLFSTDTLLILPKSLDRYYWMLYPPLNAGLVIVPLYKLKTDPA